MRIIFESNKVAAAAIAMSNESTRYNLNGVFFQDGHAVATDGQLMTVAKTNGELRKDLVEQVNVPADGAIMPISTKALTAMKKKTADYVIFENDMLTVKTEYDQPLHIEESRPIDGRFPNWKAVIDQNEYDNAPGAFKGKLLDRIAKTSAALGSIGEAVRITGESPTNAHRVNYGKQTDVYSVVMPIRD